MRFFLIILALSFNSLSGQSIQWMTLAEAIVAQKVKPKKIMIDVYTDWCGPCKLMDKNTFLNRDVAAYISKHYYAVKFNAEGNESITYSGNEFSNPNYDPEKKGRNATHQFTQYLGIRGYPSLIFMSETNDLIMPLVGYQKPRQIELFLKMIKQGDYMIFSKPEDFEKYKKSFIPRFRG
jgi:thioredoxin-related protein